LEARELQRDLDERDVVYLGADAVHAVGWGTDENAVARGDAEGAEEGVNGFVAADACEEVGGREGGGGVSVCVAQVAEELFEVVLVAGRVSLVYLCKCYHA
jgi:hypothetical protein